MMSFLYLNASMASQTNHPHFVLFPFMAQGHMIPMIDIAKVLAQQGTIITVVTTPINAARIKSTLVRAKESGLPIHLVELQFPCSEAGLPEGCENFDLVPSVENLAIKFFTAANMLQGQVENLFEKLTPRPSCIICDMCLPYTSQIANKFNVPRITFHGTCCFLLMCLACVHNYKGLESITSETEYFLLPGLPDQIEFTKSQLPLVPSQDMKEFLEQIVAADLASYGVVVNSFEELEPAYVEEYRKLRGGKVWCIGPVSLCNEDKLDKAQRGNISSIDGNHCLKWLDSQETSSVVYACLGSLCNLIPSQLIELGLGLEESQRPFIWVLRGTEKSKELEKWILDTQFEERIKGRGLLIRGWAPQVLILSHPAVGGFITHCGWNSTLEGITAGVPLITWPLFADQFSNEKLVVQVLKVGLRIGVEFPMKWGEEEKIGVLVKKEDVKKIVDLLMDEGEEGKARRERTKELAKMSKSAVKEGGSSYLNITKLIQDILQEASTK